MAMVMAMMVVAGFVMVMVTAQTPLLKYVTTIQHGVWALINMVEMCSYQFVYKSVEVWMCECRSQFCYTCCSKTPKCVYQLC